MVSNHWNFHKTRILVLQCTDGYNGGKRVRQIYSRHYTPNFTTIGRVLNVENVTKHVGSLFIRTWCIQSR